MLTGLNHITISVSDLSQSLAFYCETLGATKHAVWETGAYLDLAGIWLCLSLGEPRPANDYTHIALSIEAEDIDAFRQLLTDACIETWQQNSSEGDSVYFLDPDGHKWEAHVGDLKSRLEAMKAYAYKGQRLF